MTNFISRTKRGVSVLVLCSILSITIFSVLSCHQNDPPPTITYKKVPNYLAMWNIGIYQWRTADDPPGCPEAGTGCTLYNGQPLQLMRSGYDEFKDSCIQNNLPGFVSTHSDWAEVVPSFNVNSAEYTKLASGEYKIYFFGDSAFGVVDTTVSEESISNLKALYRKNPDH